MRQIHQADIEAMKVAVAFESDTPSRFADLTDGTYLLEAGKIVYSISFSMSGEASVSTSLSDEAAKRISARYAALEADDLESWNESQMAELNRPFEGVSSGWTALEILIARSRPTNKLFFRHSPKQSSLRCGRFIGRIKGVMKDMYQLTDKFML